MVVFPFAIIDNNVDLVVSVTFMTSNKTTEDQTFKKHQTMASRSHVPCSFIVKNSEAELEQPAQHNLIGKSC